MTLKVVRDGLCACGHPNDRHMSDTQGCFWFSQCGCRKLFSIRIVPSADPGGPRLDPETVSNLHGVFRVGLEARKAPPEVVQAGDEAFFELARRAGFPLLAVIEKAQVKGLGAPAVEER